MQPSRRFAALCISALVAMAITLTAVAPAEAARPRRSNSESTVIFVHGFDPTGAAAVDCADYWKDARTHFGDRNWDGPLRTWGYYRDNSNCTWEYPGSRDSSLNTVAQALALKIYRSYSSKGKKVDIVAHSMGGLVVRTMLRHVKKKGGSGGWPRYLYVEDVVTIATPHDGTSWAENCTRFRQCRQMVPGNSFLKNLDESLYQSHMGTDWTLISGFRDYVVSEGSGVGAGAHHKIQYRADLPGGNVAVGDHNRLKEVRTGWHRGREWHIATKRWTDYGREHSPLYRTRLALYHHRSQ